jgi:hypothetical protein
MGGMKTVTGAVIAHREAGFDKLRNVFDLILPVLEG